MKATSAVELIKQEHAALAGVLKSIQTLAESGPQDDPVKFFEAIAAMLFYVDEFPERCHHPTESNLLFPTLLKAAPELHGVIHQLEMDHVAGEGRVRKLQHQLLAWRFLGAERRTQFIEALAEYIRFYLRHMSLEESELLPLVPRLTPEQRAKLDVAFEAAMDPLVGGKSHTVYAELLDRIVSLRQASMNSSAFDGGAAPSGTMR